MKPMVGKKEVRRFLRRDNPILWGVVATFLVTGIGAILASLPTCTEGVFGPLDCETKYRAFVVSSPNEVGDTLAGFAGAFAFIWLIATVWLQSQELSEQRKELRKQRRATRAMAKAQAKQVQLLKIQGKIFRDEQRQRQENRAHQLLEQRILGIRSNLLQPTVLRLETGFVNAGGKEGKEVFQITEHVLETQNPEDFLLRLFRWLESTKTSIDRSGIPRRMRKLSFEGDRVEALECQFDVILDEVEELSSADKQRVKNLHIEDIKYAFLDLFSKEEHE